MRILSPLTSPAYRYWNLHEIHCMNRRAKKTKSVTSRDVAALAGVSLMTVSRTLRTPDLVSPSTRQKVETAVRELNYVPDLAAGALSSQRSGHIAVLLPSLRHSGFLRTVDGLSDTLRSQGYHLLIGDCYYSPHEQTELLRLMLGRRPEAIVLVSSMDSPEARTLLDQADIPIVETWDWPSNPADMVVGFSQFDAGFALSESLIQMGYTTIGFLGGPAHSDPYGEQRRKGHVAALEKADLRADIHVTVSDTPMEIEDGVTGVSVLRDKFPETEALICATDMTALGALTECQRLGLSVPEDLAIAGYGDFDFAPYLTPTLTSVKLPSYLMGEQAAELIVARIQNEDLPTESIRNLGFDIIHRQSTQR